MDGECDLRMGDQERKVRMLIGMEWVYGRSEVRGLMGWDRVRAVGVLVCLENGRR